MIEDPRNFTSTENERIINGGSSELHNTPFSLITFRETIRQMVGYIVPLNGFLPTDSTLCSN